MTLQVGQRVTIDPLLGSYGDEYDRFDGVGFDDDMADYAGREAFITRVSTTYLGVPYYHIDIDEGEFCWMATMFSTEDEYVVAEHDPTPFTPEFAEALYRATGITPTTYDVYHRRDSGMAANIWGAFDAYFGGNPDNYFNGTHDPYSIAKKFFPHQYILGVREGFVNGHDRQTSSYPERNEGRLHGVAIRHHLYNINLLTERDM